MKTLKQTTNDNLKAELFSLNQLVKFATKQEGKKLITDFIKGQKKVTLKDITVSNLLKVMPDNIKFERKKVDGVFIQTSNLRVKFSTWHLLTLIEKLDKTL